MGAKPWLGSSQQNNRRVGYECTGDDQHLLLTTTETTTLLLGAGRYVRKQPENIADVLGLRRGDATAASRRFSSTVIDPKTHLPSGTNVRPIWAIS